MENDRAFTKDEAMTWLAALAQRQPQLPIRMRPIAYHHTGSAYVEDTLRLTASSLATLADWIAPYAAALLAYEASDTRLALVIQPSKERGEESKLTGSWALYVTVHKRSPRVISHGSATQQYRRQA